MSNDSSNVLSVKPSPRVWSCFLIPATVFLAAIGFQSIIGLWLGVLAWKSNSIWPSVICHALLNATWNILHIGMELTGTSQHAMNFILTFLVAIGSFAFALCVAILCKLPRPDTGRTTA